MDPVADEVWARIRDLFPVTQRHIYLQHAGFGPASLRVVDGVTNVVETVSRRMDWQSEYLADVTSLRSHAARLLGASPEEIVLTGGTAHGLSLLARGLRWVPGDNVIVAPGEFAANVIPWTTLRRRGVEVRMAPSGAMGLDCDAVWSLVDAHTRVVSLSVVQFWNGYRPAISELVAACRKVGVRVAADGAQAVGAIAVDVEALGVDLLSAPADKWLLSGGGAGICFIRGSLADELEPALVGPASVQPLPSEPLERWTSYRPGAARFAEPRPTWYDVAATLAGVRLALELGPGAIERRVVALTTLAGDALEDHGFSVLGPWPRPGTASSGIVSFRHRLHSAGAIVGRLAASGIVARAYRDFVRLSPHFYNTDTDLLRAVDVLCGRVTSRDVALTLW